VAATFCLFSVFSRRLMPLLLAEEIGKEPPSNTNQNRRFTTYAMPDKDAQDSNVSIVG
jgi:hypothetical protein